MSGSLEKRVTEMLLPGDDAVLARLREQYGSAQAVSTGRSDVGFYTTFTLENKDHLRIGSRSFQICDVKGSTDEAEAAVGFTLFVKDGYIALLQGYANAVEKWPDPGAEIVLTYDSGDTRDFGRLKRKWA